MVTENAEEYGQDSVAEGNFLDAGSVPSMLSEELDAEVPEPESGMGAEPVEAGGPPDFLLDAIEEPDSEDSTQPDESEGAATEALDAGEPPTSLFEEIEDYLLHPPDQIEGGDQEDPAQDAGDPPAWLLEAVEGGQMEEATG